MRTISWLCPVTWKNASQQRYSDWCWCCVIHVPPVAGCGSECDSDCGTEMFGGRDSAGSSGRDSMCKFQQEGREPKAGRSPAWRRVLLPARARDTLFTITRTYIVHRNVSATCRPRDLKKMKNETLLHSLRLSLNLLVTSEHPFTRSLSSRLRPSNSSASASKARDPTAGELARDATRL